jgi:Rrf2 family transcriptional regulator, cysteine metabolism repressor
MKISTKGRYALEAVTDLAIHAGMDFESIRSIAERRRLSDNYLEQIFLSLGKAGIVESIRGPQGGYRITREPADITAGEVLHAVEGRMAPVHCLDGTRDEVPCGNETRCVTRKVWHRMMLEMDTVLGQVTIADLAEAVKREDAVPALDFSI